MCVWDLTYHTNIETEWNESQDKWQFIYASKGGPDHDYIRDLEIITKERDFVRELLKKYCKKWSFQLEAGDETGKAHFQIRISLHKHLKCREAGVIKLFPGWHVSLTSLPNRDNMFYVQKEKGRLWGPWADTDFNPFLTEELMCIGDKWWPWQKAIFDLVREFHDLHPLDPRKRQIIVVIDKVGKQGKSAVADYLRLVLNSGQLPYCNDFKEIMQAAHGIYESRKCQTFHIDIPRAIDQTLVAGMFSGLENIKAGWFWDRRNKWKEQTSPKKPCLIVFMNEFPDTKHLTNDRWRFYGIEKNQLIENFAQVVEDRERAHEAYVNALPYMDLIKQGYADDGPDDIENI